MYSGGPTIYRPSMTRRPPRPGYDPAPVMHLATIAYDEAIWEVYLEFEEDVRHPPTYRARLRFEPPAGTEGREATRTTVLIIEDSYEEAAAKARSFDDRQLQGLLRSTLPDPDEETGGSAEDGHEA